MSGIYGPSRTTGKPPTPRLVKRRKKNVRRGRRGFFANPRPLLYILTIRKGNGPRMHFDGKHFSQQARVKMFGSKDEAMSKGRDLLRRFAILRGYSMEVRPNNQPLHRRTFQ